MTIIEGTQSTIYMNEVTRTVQKVGTERGKQDTIDQIAFYLNLPENIRNIFPEIVSYVNGPEEYSYTYNYIEFPNLRYLLLDGGFNKKWMSKMVYAMNYITNSIHTIEHSETTSDNIFETYITRCKKRVNETQKYIGHEIDLLNAGICFNGQTYHRPISRIIQFFEYNIDLLVPPYICTTHGQLGPSHIFLSEMDNRFMLIDPKGFMRLHDPVIDFCKIGKAMLFATEWLEENRYNIEYTIQNKDVFIKKYDIDNYDFNKMQESYLRILEHVPMFSDSQTRIRNIAMICADLIGGLPFAYAAGGKTRVVALLTQIALSTDLLVREL